MRLTGISTPSIRNGGSLFNVGGYKYKKYTGLSDEMKAKLTALAKEDAAQGVYGAKETGNYINNYVKKNVTPDYSGIKASFMRNINALAISHRTMGYNVRTYKKEGTYQRFKYDLGYGKMHSWFFLKDHNGSDVLWYDSRVGWTQLQNKEEKAAWREMTQFYHSAWKEVRSDMKKQGYIKDGYTLPGYGKDAEVASTEAASTFDASA